MANYMYLIKLYAKNNQDPTPGFTMLGPSVGPTLFFKPVLGEPSLFVHLQAESNSDQRQGSSERFLSDKLRPSPLLPKSFPLLLPLLALPQLNNCSPHDPPNQSPG
ncbi:hypothetical protein PoB_004679800 [Plakobranchus ocellatus]|uniref:Uncharacterized protein n=1 Tax=Plakobranchus ocellatus TaxID=259542 RepID=A0AAV4BND6_9GAST|nr:hypothetical protein PoB_004679800 [Plakobranchus ocellatus]